MAEDPYKVLGVARDATEKQIRAAFLKIAKTSHPDLNPGDKKAEERFKAAANANDMLSDAEKRARFDRGEIDGTGQEQTRGGYRTHAESPAGTRYGTSTFSDDELNDILSGLFRNGARPGATGPVRGRDHRYTLMVSFVDAAQGGPQRINLPDGGEINVTIPPGTEAGQTLRLRGKGGAGTPPGDALIDIQVGTHPQFRRDGANIELDLPVQFRDAILGARVTVPTLTGAVTMAIPAGSDDGTRLRLRGKGIPAIGTSPAGDLYATIRIRIGPVDDALREFLTAWTPP